MTYGFAPIESRDGPTESADVGDHPLAFVDRPGVADNDGDDGTAVQLGRHRGHGRCETQVGHDPELIGRVRRDIAEEGEHVGGVIHVPCHQAAEDLWPERMQTELERGDDPEVAAAAP